MARKQRRTASKISQERRLPLRGAPHERSLPAIDTEFDDVDEAIWAFHNYPLDPRPSLYLANKARDPKVKLHFLKQAISAGVRRWGPENWRRGVRWWDEPGTEYMMLALYLHSRQAALLGDTETALRRIKTMLQMDPRDRVGAERLGVELGLIANNATDPAAGYVM